MNGIVFDIQHFSIHDGPGIRTTVFLKGCPLRCLWCHNPESQKPEPEIGFWPEQCLECGTCEKVCPYHACNLQNPYRVNRQKCTLCGKCIELCPASALFIIGKEMSVEEVIAEVSKDEAFYSQSGGGVTISGGEPLYQFEFVRSLTLRLKKLGYHVTIDTSGYIRGTPEDLQRLLEIADMVDLVLYDLKVIDAQKHLKYTGVNNKSILQNALQLASRYPSKCLFRYPLIPGINDSQEDIAMLTEFLASIPKCKIEVLAYHRLGINKYARIGKVYALEKLPLPEQEHLESVKLQISKLSNVQLLES